MAESLAKIPNGTNVAAFTETSGSPNHENGSRVPAMIFLGLVVLIIGYYMYHNDYYPFSSTSSKPKTPTPIPPPANSGPAKGSGSATDSSTDAATAQDAVYKGDPFDFVLGNNKIVKINNHGCWKDYNSLRIMNEANTFGWEWKGCIWEAAKRNRSMCGVQAGGECWIPADNYMTPQTVIDKSRIKMDKPGECGMGGSAYVMHLYSWPDDVRDQIANGGNPGP